MRYVVDITQKQADEIENLIDRGQYKSFAQFITTAIENQMYIEKYEIHEEKFERKNKRISNVSQPDVIIKSENRITLVEIKSQPKTVSITPFQQLSCFTQKFEEEKCWLWGQTNKILPVKIGLRVLYAALDSDQWTDLEEYRNKAADIAAEFGTIVREYEDKEKKSRDERISAGLPDEEEFKSKVRYKSHFLAHMKKDGTLDGAMPYLRFVNLVKDQKGRILIGLTEPGLNFAKLDNPVIDREDFKKSFHENEVDFYLDHISKNVKGESSAIKWLLQRLANGLNEREEINKELKKEFGLIWGTSDAVINTQRAGLMARMFEFGLIEKEKDGVKVYYDISNRGRIFLEKMNSEVGNG
jgi:Arc/MetJ-type ribon-helix-helix transcriptional regulator